MAASLSALKAEIRENEVESHKLLHESQTLINDATRERFYALEDILALPDPTPKQRDRGDLLLAFLAANDGRWVPAKVLRHKLGMREDDFSRLLSKFKSQIEAKKNPQNRREVILRKA